MANPDTLAACAPADLARFDMIIDARSPAEFAEDHVPGALNLPVLDNEERARVGTIYVQESPFLARKLGAALVARNVAKHLETVLKDQPASFRPLVYCWRGGQRSGAMATILAQVGWRTTLLQGGYKTYRRGVQERLYGPPLPLKLVLLDGGTGSGKTELLRLLADMGAQTLDLEGLAGHRGSVFGGLANAQPSQKLFESRLIEALDGLDPARTVVVEAESSKIGDRMVPPALWDVMAAAPRIELIAPREARARYLVRAYADLTHDTAALKAGLARLPVHVSREEVGALLALAEAGQHEALAAGLMQVHYDPAYARSRKRDQRPWLGQVLASDLEPPDLLKAAAAISALLPD
jgi:tRNA 2-selenouridine synthase